MYDRYEATQVSCPANTPVAAPVEVALGFGPGILRYFEIVIPAGHAGLTGIALGYGHNGVIPYGGKAFYSGDYDVIKGAYRDVVPGVPWSTFLVNLDTQAHGWEVRLAFDELSTRAVALVTSALSAADIESAGNRAMQGP